MFDKSDLDNLKALRNLITKGKYEMSGEAIVKAAVLLIWYDKLEKKIEESLKPKTFEKVKK